MYPASVQIVFEIDELLDFVQIKSFLKLMNYLVLFRYQVGRDHFRYRVA